MVDSTEATSFKVKTTESFILICVLRQDWENLGSTQTTKLNWDVSVHSEPVSLPSEVTSSTLFQNYSP